MTKVDDIKSSVIKQNQQFKVIDSTGREIVLRKPKPLKQYNLIRILGDDATGAYASMCIPLIWVESIGGNIIPAMDKKIHIDQIIDLLDEHGIDVVNNAVLEKIQGSSKEEVIEEIKK